MKSLMILLLGLVCFSFCTAGCGKQQHERSAGTNHNDTATQNRDKVIITIGTKVFTATLNDNATISAFKRMLPLNVNMSELNGNEKYYYVSNALPTDASRGGNIQAGDLMLYGDNCLVLFYESLNTSYSYTRLGKIDVINGLKTALGTGSVTVKFESQL